MPNSVFIGDNSLGLFRDPFGYIAVLDGGIWSSIDKTSKIWMLAGNDVTHIDSTDFSGNESRPLVLTARSFEIQSWPIDWSTELGMLKIIDNFAYFNNANLGIGILTPSALLHIKAGIATVAPIKLTAGVNLTTPEAGAIEFDGTNLYFTDDTGTRKTLATV